jgi:hypothetical protein
VNLMPPTPDIPPSGLSSEDRERLRERSKLLMGNRDRLEVAVAVAASQDGWVNATDISWELGMANNRVRANLLTFVAGELLDTAPVPRSGRRWFIRRPSPFWSLCTELYRDWAAESVGPPSNERES